MMFGIAIASHICGPVLATHLNSVIAIFICRSTVCNITVTVRLNYIHAIGTNMRSSYNI